MKSGGSFTGRPGFARLKKPMRKKPPPPPEPPASKLIDLSALEAALGAFTRRNGPRDARFGNVQRLPTKAAVEFSWFVPVRGYFCLVIEEAELRRDARRIEDTFDYIVAEMRRSFELAGSGPVDGAGELL